MHNDKNIKYVTLFFLCLIGGMVFLLSNYVNTYHFFAVEQNQIFLWTKAYFKEILLQPGGFSLLTGYFLNQFYLFFYVGAAITALLTLLVWWLCFITLRCIIPQARLYFLSLLPALLLAVLHSDFYYKTQGTVAFVLMLIALYVYVRYRAHRQRFIYALVIVPVLFFLAGPVVVLFSACVFIIEVLTSDWRGWLKAIGIITWACLLSASGVYLLWYPEWRYAFLPDLYLEVTQEPTAKLYYAWIALPVLLLIAPLFRWWKAKTKWMVWGSYGVQALLCAAIIYYAIPHSVDRESILLKKFEYHTQKQEWNQILRSYTNPGKDNLRAGYLNMALAAEGKLGDNAFHYEQSGADGLIVPHSRNLTSYSLLSDIDYTIGNVALAQAMAFESNLCSRNHGRPRMMLRLIETNLIYGEWVVAEKYIQLLEYTLFYRGEAQALRRFLYNDEAVESDPVLGEKRKNFPLPNYLSSPATTRKNIYAVVAQNPENDVAREYFIMVYLLAKDMSRFATLLPWCYPPEANEKLLVSFQEAVLLFSDNTPEFSESYNIDPAIAQRYQEFKTFIQNNKNNPSIAHHLSKLYGNTYWVYYYFKN